MIKVNQVESVKESELFRKVSPKLTFMMHREVLRLRLNSLARFEIVLSERERNDGRQCETRNSKETSLISKELFFMNRLTISFKTVPRQPLACAN